MDFSFLKLHTTLNSALSLGDMKNSQIGYFTSVHLLPSETYLQYTNVEDGISFASNYEVHVVDSCNNEKLDVTGFVFIEEFTASTGLQQLAIEIGQIGQDFGRRAVHLRFTNTVNSDAYYTRPILITDQLSEKTTRFDYKHYETIDGMEYSNNNFYQSIRLWCEYNMPLDASDVGDYYQISTLNNISTRVLEKTPHLYLIERIDAFNYLSLKKLFKQSIIYADTIRITNNPLLEDGERKGRSNQLNTSFKAYRDLSDTYVADFQIFDGLTVLSYSPFGVYITGTSFTKYVVTFNVPVTLNTGTVSLYNTTGLLDIYTESVMSIVNGNELRIDVQTTSGENPIDDVHYCLMSAGLVSFGATGNDAITSSSIWTFTLQAGDYNNADYNATDYFEN